MKNLIVFVFCIVSLSAATTVDFQRFVLAPDATADRAAIIGSDNTVTNAATTTTQLNYLSSASGTSGSGNLIFGTSPTLTTPTIGSFANANHNHQDSAGGGQLSATSVFSSGTVPTARLGSGTANTTTFLRGDQSYAQPVENSLNLSDNTTNNASTSKHGFLLKLDNNSAHYMDGTGAWSTPSGSGANWVASGSTNSTLPGISSAYQLIGTNGILSGDGSSPGGVVFSGGDVTLTNNATNAFSFIGASAGYTFDAPVSIGTGNALTAGTIELGAASDTTISRSAAGKIAVESKAVPLMSGAFDLTIAGPSAARTMTVPDANFTAARTDAGNTFTGNQTITGTASIQTTGSIAPDLVVTNFVRFKFVQLAYSSATNLTMDCNSGSVFYATLTNTTFIAAPSNIPTDSQTIILHLKQDGTGGRAVTFAGNFKFSGGTPTITTNASAHDVLTMVRSPYVSTNFDVVAVQNLQ